MSWANLKIDLCIKLVQCSDSGLLLTKPKIELKCLTLKTLVILLRNYRLELDNKPTYIYSIYIFLFAQLQNSKYSGKHTTTPASLLSSTVKLSDYYIYIYIYIYIYMCISGRGSLTLRALQLFCQAAHQSCHLMSRLAK